MKFFIDTANLAQIREANEMGVLDGVTTNPSLMAKENIRGEEACRRHYLEICSIVDGDVSAEVIATDFDGMVREGEALAALHKNIVVKLPCTATYSCREVFRGQEYPHQLHAGLFRRSGSAGSQGRCDVCVAVRRPSGRYLRERGGSRRRDRAYVSLLRL